MPDVPLAEAQVIWHLNQPEANEGDPPLLVVATPKQDDPRYMASWGACNQDFNEATDEQRLIMLLSQFVHFTVNESMWPEEVHKAFMDIPEYRSALRQIGAIEPAPEED